MHKRIMSNLWNAEFAPNCLQISLLTCWAKACIGLETDYLGRNLIKQLNGNLCIILCFHQHIVVGGTSRIPKQTTHLVNGQISHVLKCMVLLSICVHPLCHLLCNTGHQASSPQRHFNSYTPAPIFPFSPFVH